MEYKARGTFGYRSSDFTRADELEFYGSRDHRGLQAADLCCYIYQRQLTVTTENKKMLATQKKMRSCTRRAISTRDRSVYNQGIIQYDTPIGIGAVVAYWEWQVKDLFGVIRVCVVRGTIEATNRTVFEVISASCCLKAPVGGQLLS